MGVLKKIAQKIGVAPPDIDGEAMLALLQSGKQLDNVVEQASQIEIPEQRDPDAPLSEEQKAPVFESHQAQGDETAQLRLFCARIYWLIVKDRFRIMGVSPQARRIIRAGAEGNWSGISSEERQWLLTEMNNWAATMEGWNQIREVPLQQLVTEATAPTPPPASSAGFPASYPWAYTAPLPSGIAIGQDAVAAPNNAIAIGHAATPPPPPPPTSGENDADDELDQTIAEMESIYDDDENGMF